MAAVKQNPDFEGWFLARIGYQVKKLTNAVRDDAIAGCPIDSGDLVSTIKSRFPGQLRGIVSVGGKGPLVESAGYWKYVEYGTAPHWINSHGSWSLRSDEGMYFGRRVWHPGTTANPFMRNAVYQRRRLGRVGVL
jgi:HK97 gp10 family phage protein